MTFSLLSPVFFFDFISIRRYAYCTSLLLLILGISSIIYKGGIPLGIDFQGGSLVQISFTPPLPAEDIRKALTSSQLKDLSIQSIGETKSEYLIRFSSGTEDNIDILSVLQNAFPKQPYTIERVEVVGAKVSSNISENALEALYYALLVIAIYISGRFEDRWIIPIFLTAILSIFFFVFSRFALPMLYLVPVILCITLYTFMKLKLSFALGAIVSLIHDVLITAGILIFFGISFDLSIIAALLAIIGYSLNDTIIVYDRIREMLAEQGKNPLPLKELINKSISSTLSRTILTSATTLFVLASLLIFGGAILFPFALTLFIGISIGTLSSIFIASPILLFFGVETVEPKKTSIVLDENGVV